MTPPYPDPVLAALPVGRVVETAVGPEGLATATYDARRRYRYRLSRVWDPTLPRCAMVMLNPSTASAVRLDPTVRRCVRFAQDWGFGALEVVNLFALRSTDPHALRTHPRPVGTRNDDALLAAAASADLVVAAWGVHGTLADRGSTVRALLREHRLHHLATTRDGHPRHPLYLPLTARPSPWPDVAHVTRRTTPVPSAPDTENG